MASFFKRGAYQWEVKIRRKGYPQICKTFDSKADAETWAWTIESEMKRGIFVSRSEAENTTLREILDRYMREVTPLKKGAEREINRIKKWLARPISSRFLATIRGADIAEFRDAERKRGLAENSIRLEIALLSHVFETARTEWRMETLSNPCRSIKLPAGSKQRDRRLESGEEEYLLKCLRDGCRNPNAAPIVEFAIETAMRQSEILGLEWDRVDMNKRIAVLRDTKNGDQRIVPLSSKAVGVLQHLPRPIDGGMIFRMTQDGLIRAFSRACEQGQKLYRKENEQDPPSGFLENLRFHDLRHESTSRFFESGRLDMMEVALITGHKTLQMLKRYTHLRAEDLAKKLG
ncbi:MAG: tyrosine-type recombinase/integrase [Sulfuricella sp.]